MSYFTSSNQEVSSSTQLNSFAYLFKRYRLRAEFETYAEFSEALAKKGFFYDTSIFCHWQTGKRRPTNRQLLLSIIEVFIERNSIQTWADANEFLASTGLGYLTDTESQKLFKV